MNLKKIRQFLVVIVVSLALIYGGFRLGVWQSEQKIKSLVEIDTSSMNDVLERLKRSYLNSEDIDPQKMMYGATEGMTQALGDPYTNFFPPTDNSRSKEDLSGEFGGVGIQLGFVDKTLAVMTPMKDNPAIKAGIRAGDLILRIVDKKNNVDKDTAGITLDEAVNLIRGEKGTEVTLTMFREGDKISKDITLVRDIINVPSTELTWIDSGKVAVVAVNKFGEKTLPEWEKIVTEIKSKKAVGVILDLRNNPGGYLQRAVDLGSEFISSGVIVKQRDKHKTDVMSVDRNGKLIGMPLVVLINRGSASASEILAGALKERINIKLVGEKSFGKGTVQEPQELADGSGLHVTVAEWLLPSGKNIHDVGLEPDVFVEYKYDEKNPTADNQLDKALEVLKGEILAKK
ncbi:MAG TPA: S41 family peptidase [Spirochaetia bacterium]|nr:S41 family peptidase [Spirochaetia bacterium]